MAPEAKISRQTLVALTRTGQYCRCMRRAKYLLISKEIYPGSFQALGSPAGVTEMRDYLCGLHVQPWKSLLGKA